MISPAVADERHTASVPEVRAGLRLELLHVAAEVRDAAVAENLPERLLERLERRQVSFDQWNALHGSCSRNEAMGR